MYTITTESRQFLDELGLEVPFAEGNAATERFEAGPAWNELGESPFAEAPASEGSWQEGPERLQAEPEDEGLAWLDVEAADANAEAFGAQDLALDGEALHEHEHLHEDEDEDEDESLLDDTTRESEYLDDEERDASESYEDFALQERFEPEAETTTAGAAPLTAQQRAWILALDRSAIERLPDAVTRTRFLQQDWSDVEFPGNVPKGQSATVEIKRHWALARSLFNAMAGVVMERRVPTTIRFRDRPVVKVPGQPSQRLFAEARDAFVRMREAAKAEGVDLVILSSWRSRARQAAASANQPNPAAVARKASAHMYGLAIDLRMGVPGLPVKEINTRVDRATAAKAGTAAKMGNLVRMYRSPVYKWMSLRAREFGWYPYRNEPWHWEYNPPGLKARFEGATRGELERESGGESAESSWEESHEGSSYAEAEQEDESTSSMFLRTFTAKALGMKVAVYVTQAARTARQVEMMVFAHGLDLCRPVFKNRPASFITEAPFKLGELVEACGRPIVLVVPFLDWERLAANAMAFGKKWHRLARPETFNKVAAEALEMARAITNRAAAPTLQRLILAGHSRAYGFFDALAHEHASLQMRTGALSRPTHIWALDTTYSAPIPDWRAWLRSREDLQATVVFRQGTYRTKGSTVVRELVTGIRGKEFMKLATASNGRLTVMPVAAGKVSHCAIPTAYLPRLLAALPAVTTSGEDEAEALYEALEEGEGHAKTIISGATPARPFDEFGLDVPFSESNAEPEQFETGSAWNELGESPFTQSPMQADTWSDDSEQGAVKDEELAWLDVEASEAAGESITEESELRDEALYTDVEAANAQGEWSEEAATEWSVTAEEGGYQLVQEEGETRLPTPVNGRERMALELDGFSEYATEVTPEQRKAIDALAVEIIKSNVTNDPIYEFRVEGFADVARRIPDPKERKALEDRVSSQRALNAFNLLVDALNRKGGHAIAEKISKGSRWFGLGTRRLKIPDATTEAQFRRNRRVAFIFRQITFIPPLPTPPKPPSSVIEDRFSVRLLRAATLSVSRVLLIESFSVGADLQIIDHIDKKRAVFKVTATGIGLGAGPTRAGGSLTLTEGRFVKFKTFRLLGRGAPNIDLKSFEGRVTVFVDAGGGVGPAAKGATLSFSFDALEANGANTQPTVIRVPGGNSSVTTPGISAGAVAMGYMRMVGAPSPNEEAWETEYDAIVSDQEGLALEAGEEAGEEHMLAENELPRRRTHPQDDVKTDLWSIAFLSSVGAGKKVGGAIALFDLFNRTTNRAHRMSVTALGKASGLPVEASFRDSGYVKFKTKVPVSFSDFHNRLAKLQLKDRIGKSWRSVTIYQVDKVKELMSVEVDNLNLTGWHGFKGMGRTAIHRGDGRPAGNPDYELRLNLPAKEDIPVGFKVSSYDFGLVIRAPGDVLFDFDTDWLHYEADQRLSEIIRYINALPTSYARISVEGHTDSIEKSPGYNLALSKRRAQAVLNYFSRNKWAFNKDYAFDAARGFGATKPIVPNKNPDGTDSPTGRAKNRRVEIFLYKKHQQDLVASPVEESREEALAKTKMRIGCDAQTGADDVDGYAKWYKFAAKGTKIVFEAMVYPLQTDQQVTRVATGSIRFSVTVGGVSSVSLGVVRMVDGRASVSTNALPVGRHIVHGYYHPDTAEFQESSDEFELRIE